MTFSPGDPNYLFVVYAIGIVMISLLILSVRRLFLGLASNNWKPVKAKVESAKIDLKTDDDDNTWYKPIVTYGYRLKNNRYVRSSKVSYRLLSTMNYKKANNYLSTIRVGQEIRVYQNPKKPQQSVVIPGVNVGNFLEIIFSIIFLSLISNGIDKHREIVGKTERSSTVSMDSGTLLSHKLVIPANAGIQML